MNAASNALLHPRLVTAAATTTIIAQVVQRPIAIPVSDTAALLWPVACLAVVPLAAGDVAAGSRWLEQTSGRGPTVRMLLFVRTLAVTVGAVVVGTAVAARLGARESHAVELVRNAMLLQGLTLLGSRVGRGDAAWALPIAMAMACWTLGSGSVGHPPERWALTVQPAADALAAGVGLGAFAAGGFSFVAGSTGLSDRSC